MKDRYWLWYPGDFELYYALRQNFSRVERGFGWPAFWKSEGFRHRVVFRREYDLDAPTRFTVTSRAAGYVLVNEGKYPFGATISCPAGHVRIGVHAGRVDAFPSIYVEGDVIGSDAGWMAEDYDTPAVPAGRNKYYTRPEQEPSRWEYSEKLFLPVKTEAVGEGFLYEFETELTAVLWIRECREPLMCQGIQEAQNTQEPLVNLKDSGDFSALTVFCGESREEALGGSACYYSWHPDPETGKCPRCAFRYVFIPGPEVKLAALHQYVDIPVRASFSCDNERINRIWAVAEHTFRLCSGIFFIDGAKRDKWIWSGDAYQSLFVSRYLFADPDIEQRTLTALRGNDPITTHINTIVDYSLLWVLGVAAHVEAYGDLAFLRRMWPKMQSLMAFCEENTDEHGFLTARTRDWTFVDWAELDKEGPFGAIQMLYAAAWRVMGELAARLDPGSPLQRPGQFGTDRRSSRGEPDTPTGCPEADSWYKQPGTDRPSEPDEWFYVRKWEKLRESIDHLYWNEEKGAYTDSFTSGRRHVSRQTNIWALLFGVADHEKRERILQNVIYNEAVPPVRTPYFQFYELDLLASTGALDQVYERIQSYWGGMLDRGAATFWEDFHPEEQAPEQYGMYGDPFGKSLCHAWAASPIYLLARYFIGLSFPGDGSYVLQSRLTYFRKLEAALPLGSGPETLHILWDGRELKTEITGA